MNRLENRSFEITIFVNAKASRIEKLCKIINELEVFEEYGILVMDVEINSIIISYVEYLCTKNY